MPFCADRRRRCVLFCCRQKCFFVQFAQNDSHRRYLFKTHPNALVYCSPTSTFWGVGLSKGEKECLDPAKWKGANKLGDLLTKVRDEMMLDPEQAFPVEDPVVLTRGRKRTAAEVAGRKKENADPKEATQQEEEPPTRPVLTRQNAVYGRP